DAADAARRAAGDRIAIITVDMDAQGTVAFSRARRSVDMAPPPADAAALLLHTSGTTGRPLRVALTHASLCASARNFVQTYALTPDEVTLCAMPLFHVHGLVASMLATCASGGTIVVPGRFNPLSFWRIADEHAVTWFSAV